MENFKIRPSHTEEEKISDQEKRTFEISRGGKKKRNNIKRVEKNLWDLGHTIKRKIFTLREFQKEMRNRER